MSAEKEIRRRPGTKLRIGDQIFGSIKAAARALGKSDSYIFDRIRFNNSVMPDGTRIELIDEEQEHRDHIFTIRLTDEMNDYLESAATRMGVSKAWVWEKLFHYGRKALDEEMGRKSLDRPA